MGLSVVSVDYSQSLAIVSSYLFIKNSQGWKHHGRDHEGDLDTHPSIIIVQRSTSFLNKINIFQAIKKASLG